MIITVYGTGTSGHHVVTSTIRKVLTSANIPFQLKEESDVSEFISHRLSSVPAIQVDEEEVFSIKKNGEFNQSLRSFIKDLLSKNNFGDLPKIIVPTDFSDSAVNAFYYAHRLASDLGAVVKVLHACIPHSSELSEAAVVDFNMQDMKRELLDEFIDRVDKEWGSDLMQAALVEKEFRLGFPADEIIDCAKESHADLIVMGTTGESGAIKRLLGSVSTKVMKQSSCNVLLVPPHIGYKKIKNFLYATNDLSLDKSCISKLSELAIAFDSTIHLVHVKSTDGGPSLSDMKSIMQSHSEVKFVATTIESEDIIGSLNTYAASNEIDVIAMGAKNRSFFERLTHKSITKKMALHADRAIMILRT